MHVLESMQLILTILSSINLTVMSWISCSSVARSTTPAFVEYIESSTSSNPIYYNREPLDTTSSFSSTYFKAPKNGVYLFFWNMEASSRRLESFLQVNDQTVGRTIGDGRDSGYDSSSNLVIVRLTINDLVKVKQDSTADGDQTMISGYFLFL